MGVAAACSLALCSLVNSPGELFTGTAPAAQVVVLSDAERNETYGGTGYAGSEKKERLRDRLRRFFLAQPSVLRGFLLLPFWAMGKALPALLHLSLSALGPILQPIFGVLLNAALLFGLFALVFKLLFPDVPLKKLLTKRNVLLLAAGSLVLSATDAILRVYWEDYRPVSIAVRLALGVVVLSLLCWRIFGKRSQKPAASPA